MDSPLYRFAEPLERRLFLSTAPMGGRATPAPAPIDARAALHAERNAGVRGVTVDRAKGFVSSLNNGDYVKFSKVRFSNTIKSVQVRLAAGKASVGSKIQFRLDRPNGPLLGALTIQRGDNDVFWTQSAPVKGATGVHDLYAVFRGRDAGKVDFVRFSDRPVVRILPLGDSITESRGGLASYRRYLFKLLEKGRYSADFVGSKRGVWVGSGAPKYLDFDMNHEGYSTGTADAVLAGLQRSIRKFPRPDVVLLHVGTNDLSRYQSVDSTLSEISQIIDLLRTRNPNVKILLAQIIPSDRYDDAERVALNQGIASLAAEKSSSTSPIIVVDQSTGFNLDTDTSNGLNPNDSGEIKMAKRWYAALRQTLA